MLTPQQAVRIRSTLASQAGRIFDHLNCAGDRHGLRQRYILAVDLGQFNARATMASMKDVSSIQRFEISAGSAFLIWDSLTVMAALLCFARFVIGQICADFIGLP